MTTTTTNWATEQGYTGADAAIISRRIRLAQMLNLSGAEVQARYSGGLLVDRALRDWAKSWR